MLTARTRPAGAQATLACGRILPQMSPRAAPFTHRPSLHPRRAARSGATAALDPASASQLLTAAADPQVAAASQAVFDLAGLDSATAGTLSAVLKPVLSLASLLMIVRIIMTWYPEVDATKMPWSIAYTPTEGLLAATRKVVKPFNGLDVSPIVWVALISFVSEILTGPQGILSLIERKGI